MRIEERSYSTKIVRPRPAIYIEPDGSFIVISTSWGDPEHGLKVNDDIAKYIQAAKADVEVTSPFEFLTSLSVEANYLRIATLISNESLYRGSNKTEYQAGVETLLLLRKGSLMAYAQVGSPHLLIQKKNQLVTPISVGFEAVLEMSGEDQDLLSPLPQSLLGIDGNVNVRTGDFRIDESDRLLLYGGSVWPKSLWSPDCDFQQLTQKLVQASPESPFWLGVVSLED
ncbi:MAG TPA: hypothetical protein VIG33_00445 [Pseudobdellovibrionaceae bacterium]|jgi:hypothetical protein